MQALKHILQPWKITGTSEWVGVSKVKTVKGKYEAEWEFLGERFKLKLFYLTIIWLYQLS